MVVKNKVKTAKQKKALLKLKLLKLKAKKRIKQRQSQNQKQEVVVNNIINQVTKNKRKRRAYKKEEKLENKLSQGRPVILQSLAAAHNNNTLNAMQDLNKAKFDILQNRLKELETLRIANNAFGNEQTRQLITDGREQASTLLIEELKDDPEILFFEGKLKEAAVAVEQLAKQNNKTAKFLEIVERDEEELQKDILKNRTIEEEREDIIDKLNLQIRTTTDEDEKEKLKKQVDELENEQEKLRKTIKKETELLKNKKKESEEVANKAIELKEQLEKQEEEAKELKERIEVTKNERIKALNKARSEKATQNREEQTAFYNKEFELLKELPIPELKKRFKDIKPEFGVDTLRGLLNEHVKNVGRLIKEKEKAEKERLTAEKEQTKAEKAKAEKAKAEKAKAEKAEKEQAKAELNRFLEDLSDQDTGQLTANLELYEDLVKQNKEDKAKGLPVTDTTSEKIVKEIKRLLKMREEAEAEID